MKLKVCIAGKIMCLKIIRDTFFQICGLQSREEWR